MSNINETELTSEEEKLILQLNQLNVKEIIPKTNPLGKVNYPVLEDLLHGYNLKRIQHLLSSLEAKGFLIETEKRSIILCPRCSSHIVSSVYTCTKCASDNIERLDFIEHPHCGYIDERAAFENNFQFICPNCNIELKYVEPDDKDTSSQFRIVGTNFACLSCDSKFERPNVTHECQNCNTRFSFKNSNYIKLVSYELAEKSVQLTPKQALQDVLDLVQKKLEEKGLEITLYGEVPGKSLGSHAFDIIARADPILIVGDVSVEGDSSGLIALFGKKMDVDPSSTFYIDLSGNYVNSDFGKEQNIASFNGIDDGFQEDFENYLNGIIIEPIKKEDPKSKKKFGIF
jgi:hypothetical protein